MATPWVPNNLDKLGADNKLSAANAAVYMSSAAIGTAYIADAAITNAKINDLSASKINTGTLNASVVSVTNLNASNIATGTLSVDRIASNSIGSIKIADLAITNAKINDLSASKINTGTLNASIVSVTNLSATNITGGTLSVDRIAANSIVGGKISTTNGTNLDTNNFNLGAVTKNYAGAVGLTFTNTTSGSYTWTQAVTANSGTGRRFWVMATVRFYGVPGQTYTMTWDIIKSGVVQKSGNATSTGLTDIRTLALILPSFDRHPAKRHV